MILPFVFVKLRGKTTSGKAFLLAFLNWIIIYALFMSIYYAIFPGDTDTVVNSAPALWLFVSWRYMTFKSATKNTTSHNTSPNSIDDIERKFNLNLSDTQRETLTRGTIKFALFTFKLGKTNFQDDKFKYLVVVYDSSKGFRYFAVESSFTGTNMLCEWIFDSQDKEIGHLNYGGVALSEFDSSAQEVNEKSSEEVLIDQILAIIDMKVEPEFKSTKNESGWIGTGKKATVQGNQNDDVDDDNEHKKDLYDDIESDKLKMPVLSILLFVLVIVIFIAIIPINYDKRVDSLKTDSSQIAVTGGSAFLSSSINKSYPVYLIEEESWIYVMQVVGNEIRSYKTTSSLFNKGSILEYFDTVKEEDIPARVVIPSLHLIAILIPIISGLIMIYAWIYYFQKEKNILGFPKKTDSKEYPTSSAKSLTSKTEENIEQEFESGTKSNTSQTETSSQRLDLLNSLSKSKILSDSHIMFFSKKFRLDFVDATIKLYNKDNLKYALISLEHLGDELIKIKHLIVTEVQSKYRYFATESSALGSVMLCEWTFDENDNNTQHLNYGPAGMSIIDTKTNNITKGDEVIIEQIHTIVSMKVEPEYISTKNGGGWNTVQSETYKNIEEKVSELIKKMNTANVSSALKKDSYAEDIENKKDAFWYEMKAEEGDANAQYNLAHCYSNGRGADQNFEKAVYWYEKAAKQNYALAQNNLGSCYSIGQGIPQNHEKAFYWFQKAAEQGITESQYNLGVYYYKGHGIEQDYKLAAYWYQKASDQGLAKAQNNLGTCYFKGHGVVKDLKQAINWFEKAANQGYVDAQFNLGQVYNTDNSVLKDEKQAFKWYKYAAEQGNAEAQNLIGFFYNNGKGVLKDPSQGFYWFQKAAEQGHINAQFNCGICYIYGDGIAQDESQGIKWIKKAAKQGDINSIRLLAAAGIQIDK